MCIPSSLEISSLENVSPGIKPRFLSQKIEAKDPVSSFDERMTDATSNLVRMENVPEKKIPSTAAKAISRSPKIERSSEIHLRAQSAFFLMQGTGESNLYQRIHLDDKLIERERTSLYGLEELVALFRFTDVCIDQKRVNL